MVYINVWWQVLWMWGRWGLEKEEEERKEKEAEKEKRKKREREKGKKKEEKQQLLKRSVCSEL
jgi:hypothetical protein